MLEDSIESFVTQWKPYAATAELFAHFEGSPLLECRAAGKIFHVFERTGPYLSQPGMVQMIIHPVTESVIKLADGSKQFEVIGHSQIRAQGILLLRQENILVIDAGIPLVVGVLGDLPADLNLGDWLHFESSRPIHGFVLPPARTDRTLSRGAESD